MNTRARIGNRCLACRMRPDLCFCSKLTPISTRTKVSVVMHCAEQDKSTSTARLLQLLLPNSEIHKVGTPGAPVDLSQVASPTQTPLLLFPEPSARVLDKEFVEAIEGDVVLVVPDGTWKQARKIAHNLVPLPGMKRIQLPAAQPSRYTLRRNQRDGSVCTLEAVARALEVLEGIEVRQELERYLTMLVDRVTWSRTTSALYDGSFV